MLVVEALQWIWGNGIYFRGIGEQRPNFERTKTILGNRKHTKTHFNVWGTGQQANLFQGNKGTSTNLGGP